MTFARRFRPYAAIFSAFLLFFAAAVGLGAFAFERLAAVGGMVEKTASSQRQADILLTKVVEEASAVRLNQNMSLIAMTEPARIKERAAVHEAIGGVAALIGDYEKYVDAASRPAFVRWRDGWNDYVSMNDTLNEKAINETPTSAAEYYLYSMSDAFRQNFLAPINEVIAANARAANHATPWSDAYASVRSELYMAGGIAALICVLAAILMMNAFAAHHPRHMHEVAQRLDETLLKIGEISGRIVDIAGRTSVIALGVASQAGRSSDVDASQVASASKDLTEQASVLKETVRTLISEVDAA